jgi:5-(carboxyamino)imidazole ribonucleotide synthase
VSERTARTVGVLGGGQLGRMLALAGYPLGLRFRFFDPAADAPAGQLAEHVAGAYLDNASQQQFCRGLDVATFEFENVPVACARAVAERVPVFPSIDLLATKQDRFTEKSFFQAHGIPTAPFATIDSPADLEHARARIGVPAILKTRRDGYDGKGQALIRDAAQAAAALGSLGGKNILMEGFISFTRELSLIAVRGKDGATAFYPLVENIHRDGILRRSLAPAPHAAQLQAQAETHARKIMEAVAYVGVLAIEFFHCGDRLLANEMAPRVHNSGHWTIEGAETSQFENHLRAILGLPLGSTAARGHAAMINLIGECPDPRAILAIAGAQLHLYGKEPRPGRKIGHITLVADDLGQLLEAVERLERLLFSHAAGSVK